MNWTSSLSEIPGLGPTTTARFKKLRIENLKDLVFHFPFRYDDFSHSQKIKDVQEGEEVNIVGKIELIQNRRSKNKKTNLTEALIKDETEEIKVIWFNQAFLTQNLKIGNKVSLTGKIKNNLGVLTLVSPNYEKVTPRSPAVHTQGIVPRYHTTEKLTSKQIRFALKSILPLIKKSSDWLPEEIREKLNLLPLNQALKQIHFPQNFKKLEEARRRLSFDELFLLQLKSQIARREIKNSQAEAMEFKEKEIQNFVKSLPFQLTTAQRKSAWEIIQDLGKKQPMVRLLEGEVGSGKTLVAVLTMLNTALNNKQSVLMVPTEILAEQHFNSISKLLEDFPRIKIGLVSRSAQKSRPQKLTENQNKKEKINKMAQECQIIIGTHSLIQEKIFFSDLDLAVIDEQHRFGVEQRKTLIQKSGDKNTIPHLLSLTATPIPRTLALGLFGDLDISLIDELPQGRKKIITKVVPEEKRNKAYNFIREKIEEGRQVFFICPLIDPSDKLEIKSVREEYKKLKDEIFPNKKIALLHGKLKPSEKEKIMKDFLNHHYDILVSTSVVEVGVDIPNASIMVIEGAERFGLAQLHQFRGRVGRGEHQSYCFLFTDKQSQNTRERLYSLEKNQDGFALAKTDLKLRGSGNIFGTSQSGFPELKIADLFDYKLMKEAQEEAQKLISKDPNLNTLPRLKEKFENWKKNIHWE